MRIKAMSRCSSGDKQVIIFLQYKKSRSSLFILDNRKWTTFFIKDDNDNLWVEVIIVTFFNAVTTVDVLTANNNNVNRTLCMTIKSSFRFEGINKVYSDFSHWQILSFVGPWSTIVEAAVEVRSIRNTACVENNGVGENILEHNFLSAKKCGKAPKSVWKSLITSI